MAAMQTFSSVLLKENMAILILLMAKVAHWRMRFTLSATQVNAVFPRLSARAFVKNFGQKGGRLLEGGRLIEGGAGLLSFSL